jgi:hypothetical protein
LIEASTSKKTANLMTWYIEWESKTSRDCFRKAAVQTSNGSKHSFPPWARQLPPQLQAKGLVTNSWVISAIQGSVQSLHPSATQKTA